MIFDPSARKQLAISAFTLLLVVARAEAAAPTISNLSLRGLRTGATTTLVLNGADLLPEPRLLLSVPIAQQVVKEGATANQVQIDVTLDAATPPGIYQLRLATADGISTPLAVGVDALPEMPFAAEVASLPVALSGSLQGSNVLRTSFTGTKGQHIVVEVEGRRLGVELNPVVHLLDGRGVQLAWAQAAAALTGDARLTAELPADGRYTVELHDALYRGPGPGSFRLKIGAFHYADLVIPLGVKRGTKSPLEFASTNLPAGAKADSSDAPAPGQFAAAWPVAELLTGGRPRLIYSDYEELSETPVAAGGPPQKLAVPMAVSGRIGAAKEEDHYQLMASPGQALRIEALAARVGSPLDGVLSIRNMQGGGLASSDDQPSTTDPGLDFTMPAGTDSVLLAIKDLEGRGGAEYVYRLAVTPKGTPDYGLTLFTDREPLPRQGVTVMRVRADRRGYNGPIKLNFAGLPGGVRITGDEIPAGATDTLVTFETGDQQPAPVIATVIGDSTQPNTAIRRVAQVAGNAAAKYQPWLADELALSGTQSLPISVAWSAATADNRLPLGARLPLEVQVARTAGAVGPVRLSLLMTQIIPKKTIKENNQDKQVDDLDRALRLDGTPTVAADQSAGVAALLVPRDLPVIPYDLAVQAELLSADGKAVLATAVTPARRMTPASPLTLALSGDAKVEAKAGSGETGKLTGSVQRLGEFKVPLIVTLAGLPPELPAPELTLAPDQAEFALPVAFPFGSPQGALANVRVVAVDRANPQAVVSSNKVPVAVNVVPGGPPPALYRLFEDESSFLARLTEGGGKIALETTDRYSGTAALSVTPDQKFRQKLPGLGLNIAENPGEGEYRFLRFAWKKRGGGNVLLQLAANGMFGPLRGAAGASYRYEAGPNANPFNAAAVKLDDKLPAEWTVVTRDLFADFGAFRLDGLALTASDGEAALFDQIYLARTADDLKGCPSSAAGQPPLAVFEDQPEFAANLTQGGGTATLATDQKYSGTASVKVTPDQRFNPALPGLGVKIREKPAAGEYRYLQFAWKKQGGQRICLQLNHDGQWGPTADKPGKFRYDAGPGEGESYGAALRLDPNLPSAFVVVTRDLFADFGEFTLTGLALSPQDGEFALFDHIYLGREPRDFEAVKP